MTLPDLSSVSTVRLSFGAMVPAKARTALALLGSAPGRSLSSGRMTKGTSTRPWTTSGWVIAGAAVGAVASRTVTVILPSTTSPTPSETW